MGMKVLVIDDEEMILNVIELMLGERGHEVVTFSDPEAGEREAIEHDYDLILTDLRMPRRNGAEIARAVMSAKPKTKMIVTTAYPSDHLADEALAAGATGLLKKPFEIAALLGYLSDESRISQ